MSSVIADAVVIRPCCLVVTIFGMAFFMASLPIAVVSNSVDSTSHALVVGPAEATFTRPLGDFDDLSDLCD